MVNKECQINIQSEMQSTGINTRPKKHKEVQTEIKEDEDINEKNSNLNKVVRILTKRGQLIEEAINENIDSLAFLSSLNLNFYKNFLFIIK
jgi:type I restriction-modification system DNA methylase subunit